MNGPTPTKRKRLHVALALLGVLALASAAGLFWLGRTLRSPEFRAELVHLAQQATGRSVAMDGELEVSVFPWLGFTAHGLVLGNAEGFPGGPMLRAKTLSAHIKVLPLFSRELAFDTVELVDANLELYVDAEGRTNWESLLSRAKAQESALEGGGRHFRRFSVRGLAVSGGAARLKDEQHGQELALSELNLRTGRIAGGESFPFSLECLLDWPRPGLSGRVQLSGKLDPDPAKARHPLTDTTIVAEVAAGFLPRSAPRAGLSAAVTWVEGKDLKLTDLRIKAMGLDVTGELTFLDALDAFRMRGSLSAARFDPRTLLNAYWPHAVSMQHQGALRSAEGRVDIVADKERLELANVSVKVDGAQVQGRGAFGFGDKPTLDFELKADKADADAYVAALSSNSTDEPLVGDDLPMRYLGSVAGRGTLRAEHLKLAGVTAQGAELEWSAGGGTHRVALRPAKGEGGVMAAEASVTFAEPGPKGGKGTEPVPVLALTASARMDGVAARQISWANTPDFTMAGRGDFQARATLPKTPIAPQTRIGQVLRKLSGEARASIPQAVLEWPQRAISAPGKTAAPAFRMAFSSLSAQMRLTPGAGTEESWAGQAEFGVSAVGTKPALSLEAKGSGQVRTAHRASGLRLTGASASGRLRGWFLPERENEAVFTVRGALDFKAETLSLTSASVQGWGLNLLGQGAVSRIFSRDAALVAKVRCQDSDPKRFLAAMDMKVPRSADRRALARLNGEGDLALSAKGLQLNNLSAQFDDTQLRGSYGFTNFDDPQHRFAAQIGFLDLDRYYPDAPKRGPNDPKPAPEPLPVDFLREADMDGTLQFRGLKYAGLVGRNLKAGVTAHGGALAVKSLEAEFYGGRLTGEFSAQVQGQQRQAQVRVSLAGKDFALSPFMLGWVGKEYATGKADMFLDVAGAGATDQEVTRTLEGLAGFKVLDGSYVLSGAQERPAPGQGGQRRPASATGQSGGVQGGGSQSSVSVANAKPGTPFRMAEARFRVRRGVFQTDDFRLDAPTVQTVGKGSFSLPEESISMALTASMAGLPDVPIRVHGRLRDPEVDISAGGLINNTIKELLGLPFKPIKFFKDLLF